MKEKTSKTNIVKTIINYIIIAIGALVMALGFNSFCIPNKIAPGGFSGLSSIINYFTGLPTGAVNFAMCLIFFLILLKSLGVRYVLKSLYGTAAFSLFLDLTSNVPCMTTDMFLASVFGGLVMGVGIGIVFKAGGTTGGTDLIGYILSHIFTTMSSATWMMVCDCMIIIGAAVAFKDITVMFYSIICIYVMIKMSDFISEGFYYVKAFYIFTDKPDEITQEIFDKLQRGVTYLKAQGGYNRQDKVVLLCAVDRFQVSQLRKIVSTIDPTAFVILSDVHEVFGEGFKGIDIKSEDSK